MPSNEADPLLAAWLVDPKGYQGDVLRILLELSVRVAGAEEGSLLLLDAPVQELVFAMTVGDEASARALRGQRVPVAAGITGLAAQTREVQIGSPTFTDVKQTTHRDLAGGPAWVVAAPILVEEELVGVMTGVTFSVARRFDAEAGELFGRAAAVVGVVLDQGRRLAALGAGRGDEVRAEADRAAAALVSHAASSPAKLVRLTGLLRALEGLL